MSCTFTFVRHGETYWNTAHKFQGQVNVPLNERGLQQAAESARALAAEPFTLVLSSPLARARRTAEIIAQGHAAPIRDENLLVEQSYGIYEGESTRLFLQDPSCPMYFYFRDATRYRAPIGGESFAQLAERARRLVREVLEPAAGEQESVLVAGHAAIFCALFLVLEDAPLERFWEYKLPNAGYAKYRCDGPGQWRRI